MKTAKFLRGLDWTGDARVYHLSEPHEGASLVIVSATDAPFSGPETYLFPATEESLEKGDPSSWGELGGSFRGRKDHAEALRNAGYEVSL